MLDTKNKISYIIHLFNLFRKTTTTVLITVFLLKPSCLLGYAFTNKPINIVPSIQQSPNYASVVINTNTGKVLFSRNAHQQRYPASLTKMMTLYLTFSALKQKKLYPLQKLTVSKQASHQPKSNINLKAGQKITVRHAIHAVIVKSANDASTILSEAVAGNTKKFVTLMNKIAKKLKMNNTKFQNPHGLHDKKQYTTAADMAKLAIALKKDFSRYYHLFSMRSFIYRGKEIRGHNMVLNRYEWADGLKTGYVNASGFNLATSTKHPKGSLVAVVMGGQTAKIRDNHMIKLLDNAYAKLGNYRKKGAKRSILAQAKSSKTGVFQYAGNISKKSGQSNYKDKFCWDVLEIH